MGWRAASFALAAAAVAAHPAHTHSSPEPVEKKGPRRHHCGAPKPDMEKARALRRTARFNADCQYALNTVNPAHDPTSELVVKVVVHIMTCGTEGKLAATDAASEACINGQMQQLNEAYAGNKGVAACAVEA